MPDEIVPDECCGCSKAAHEHVLSEFYDPVPDAKKALQTGVKQLRADDGGFLCIPADDISKGLVPRNRFGHRELNPDRTDFDSVTIVDARHGVERTYLPPVGDQNSELTTFAGHIMERDLTVDLGWQGSYAAESLCSRLDGGGSSVSMYLAEQTLKGAKRFYVATLMGIFPGQKLRIDLLNDLFTVDRLGQDAKGQFFETKEAAPRVIDQKAPLYNKHNIGVLALSDTSNSDNQGASLGINRRAYGAGDVFLMSASLQYQSNVFSGRGDEGGVGCAVDLLHDLESFHGEVDSWTRTPGRGETVAVYKTTADAGSTRNTQKLGTSRPLINLERKKWTYDGVANVLPPHADSKDWLTGIPASDHLDGCILVQPETPPADWGKFVGAFIALVGRPGKSADIDETDASEYYKSGEKTPAGDVVGDVYRWWYVTEVQDTGTGSAYVYVDRPIQRTFEVVKSGPQLFRDSNVTESKEHRALPDTRRPGARLVESGRHGPLVASLRPRQGRLRLHRGCWQRLRPCHSHRSIWSGPHQSARHVGNADGGAQPARAPGCAGGQDHRERDLPGEGGGSRLPPVRPVLLAHPERRREAGGGRLRCDLQCCPNGERQLRLAAGAVSLQTSWFSRAYTISFIRLSMSSFSKIERRCAFTVPSVIDSRSAISLLRRPPAAMRTTSISRAVRTAATFAAPDWRRRIPSSVRLLMT
jgi:hypothetical protein